MAPFRLTDEERAPAERLVAEGHEREADAALALDGGTSLVFRSPEEVRASTPEERAWVWEGYLAEGAVTLLAGKPKGGKSTLAFAVAEALVTGARTFLGRRLAPAPVVYVSEEGDATARDKLPPDGSAMRVLTRSAAWPRPSWTALIAVAVEEADRAAASLLVVDTLAFWSDLAKDEEKDAGAAQATMGALVAAAEAGLAVLLVHHQRKSGGEEGDAIRGSGALTAAVEALVELERVPESPPGHRRLVAVARWPEAPGMLLIERDAATAAWRVLGEGTGRDDAGRIGWRDALVRALPIDEPGATHDDLKETLGAERPKWMPALKELVDEGAALRSGEGKKGSPFVYRRAPDGAVPGYCPSPRTETAEQGAAGFLSRRPPSRREEADGKQPSEKPSPMVSSTANGGAPEHLLTETEPEQRMLNEDELVASVKRDFSAVEIEPDDEADELLPDPAPEPPPRTWPRPGPCDCRRPAPSPRAAGPDFCWTCKRSIADPPDLAILDGGREVREGAVSDLATALLDRELGHGSPRYGPRP